MPKIIVVFAMIMLVHARVGSALGLPVASYTNGLWELRWDADTGELTELTFDKGSFRDRRISFQKKRIHGRSFLRPLVEVDGRTVDLSGLVYRQTHSATEETTTIAFDAAIKGTSLTFERTLSFKNGSPSFVITYSLVDAQQPGRGSSGFVRGVVLDSLEEMTKAPADEGYFSELYNRSALDFMDDKRQLKPLSELSSKGHPAYGIALTRRFSTLLVDAALPMQLIRSSADGPLAYQLLSSPVRKPLGPLRLTVTAGRRDDMTIKSLQPAYSSPNSIFTHGRRIVFNGLETLMRAIFTYLKSWGLVIVAMALLLKILTLPLFLMGERLKVKIMGLKKAMAPELTACRESYRSDLEKRYFGEKAIYKRYGYRATDELLLALLQIVPLPLMFLFFQVILQLPDLNRESFLWIDDLARPDKWSTLGNFSLPLIGNSLNLLPLLMLLLWITSLEPAKEPRQHLKHLAGVAVASSVFLFLYTFPSSLMLYWLVINVFQIGARRWPFKSRRQRTLQYHNTSSAPD